jgi:adenylate cyclase
VAFRLFRFRKFSRQLMLLLAGLLAVVLGAVYLLITRANRTNALDNIAADLRRGTKFYAEAVAVRIEVLARSGTQMANDYAFRQVLRQETVEVPTIRSALRNSAERIGVPVLGLFTLEGGLVAIHGEGLAEEHCRPFRLLIEKVNASESGLIDNRYATDFAYLNGRLHGLVVVPLNAPDVVNWFGLAFPIDDTFAAKIKTLADLEVTFLGGTGQGRRQVLATTLEAALAESLAGQPHGTGAEPNRETIYLGREPYETTFTLLPLLDGDPAEIALQRSLNAELAPARRLERIVLVISVLALFAAMLVAFGIARGVSQPLQELARHTKLVATGDYTQRIDLPRTDEFGQLATAFNQMTAGLAERDRVRNLLGMVVSPEIATQLLHSDLKLGGEEREVTVLFCDLRDFTSFSEKMAPTEVLALLNRYLDRMSGIIEQHGGVIDKYIGDAIMALFGAPVATPDAANRAVAAARAMARALDELNGELRREGRPALAFGIGINTGRVVAGNMGSRTRLNYTVIGDNVNLASRLEGLTKDPAYDTPIIATEATLAAMTPRPHARALGEVRVKGKAEAVRIFAISAKGETTPPYSV